MLAACGCTVKGTAGASEVLCLTPALRRAGISFKKLLLKLQGVFNQGLGAVAQWFAVEVLPLRDGAGVGWGRELGNVQDPFFGCPSSGSGCAVPAGSGLYDEDLSPPKCQIGSPSPLPGHMARNRWSTGAAPGDIILAEIMSLEST